jgi:hypothetical protein
LVDLERAGIDNRTRVLHFGTFQQFYDSELVVTGNATSLFHVAVLVAGSVHPSRYIVC